MSWLQSICLCIPIQRIFNIRLGVLYSAWRRTDLGTYFILKDFRSYAEAQRKIDERYRDTNGWAKTVMTNTAKAGKFSSDRTIEEYATEIWKLTKTPVEM